MEKTSQENILQNLRIYFEKYIEVSKGGTAAVRKPFGDVMKRVEEPTFGIERYVKESFKRLEKEKEGRLGEENLKNGEIPPELLGDFLVVSKYLSMNSNEKTLWEMLTIKTLKNIIKINKEKLFSDKKTKKEEKKEITENLYRYYKEILISLDNALRGSDDIDFIEKINSELTKTIKEVELFTRSGCLPFKRGWRLRHDLAEVCDEIKCTYVDVLVDKMVKCLKEAGEKYGDNVLNPENEETFLKTMKLARSLLYSGIVGKNYQLSIKLSGGIKENRKHELRRIVSVAERVKPKGRNMSKGDEEKYAEAYIELLTEYVLQEIRHNHGGESNEEGVKVAGEVLKNIHNNYPQIRVAGIKKALSCFSDIMGENEEGRENVDGFGFISRRGLFLPICVVIHNFRKLKAEKPPIEDKELLKITDNFNSRLPEYALKAVIQDVKSLNKSPELEIQDRNCIFLNMENVLYPMLDRFTQEDFKEHIELLKELYGLVKDKEFFLGIKERLIYLFDENKEINLK